MNAELKEISFADDVFDSNGRFLSTQPVSVPMHATIGMNESEGGDLFVFQACNAAWILNKSRMEMFLVTKALICDNRTTTEIEEYLSKIVHQISGEQWADIVKKVEVMADWEFAK